MNMDINLAGGSKVNQDAPDVQGLVQQAYEYTPSDITSSIQGELVVCVRSLQHWVRVWLASVYSCLMCPDMHALLGHMLEY